jgi:hypothetical protein
VIHNIPVKLSYQKHMPCNPHGYWLAGHAHRLSIFCAPLLFIILPLKMDSRLRGNDGGGMVLTLIPFAAPED